MGKILHIDFTGPYTEGMTYQENIFPAEHRKLGHYVEVWSGLFRYDNGMVLADSPTKKTLPSGVVLRRWEYVKYINGFISNKLRNAHGIYEALVDLKPNLIMQHDTQTMITSAICRYVENYPKTLYIIDCHSDYYNSANTFFSRYFLHRLFYRKYVRMAYAMAMRVYCISPEVREFVTTEYGLEKKKTQLLPLGSIVPKDEEYQCFRNEYREKLGIDDDVTVFIHSGKLTSLKKTSNIIQAMRQLQNEKVRLLIIGSASGSLLGELQGLVSEDDRVLYLGWRSGDELIKWLCAGDVYLQPGTQSNTLQTAVCCRETIIAYPYENYSQMIKEFGYATIGVQDLVSNMEDVSSDRDNREKLREKAYLYAREHLDYSKQAREILEDVSFA